MDHWLRLFARGTATVESSAESVARGFMPPKGVEVYYQSPPMDRRYLRSVTVYRLRRQPGAGQFVLEP